MTRARYIGRHFTLLGKIALIRQHPDQPDTLLAQFNDISTGLGFGWHPFDYRDFVIESEDF